MNTNISKNNNISRNYKNVSIIFRITLTYTIILLIFSGLSIYIIHSMTNISKLNELTYLHPFTVSNAVLRIQLNIEKINGLVNSIAYLENGLKKEASSEISLLNSKIHEDFELINDRFLGDKSRFNIAYQEYNEWINQIVVSLDKYDHDRNRRNLIVENSKKLNFIREMEYLTRFAENKAVEFLNTSQIRSKMSITIAYVLVIAFFVLGLFMIRNLIERINNPLNILLHAVEEIQEGNYKQKVYIINGGKEFSQLANAFNEMMNKLSITHTNLEEEVQERTKKLQVALDERNALIRELYHRTKNNMQVISSIISLKSDSIANNEFRAIMQDLENKIQSMALVHQMLYKSDDLSHIFLDDYIIELENLIINTFDNDALFIEKDNRIDHIPILFDFATPCGLIINELLTNSIKYAFHGFEVGKISINANRKPKGTIILEYKDNGIGLPKDFSLDQCDTLGFTLIKTIVTHQLNGNIEIDGKDGMSCKIEFADYFYTERL